MVTIYDLLEISEDASKEEIERAYQNMIISYQTNPNNTEEENKQNEFILNKLKLAYEILSDDERRKKYDENLSNKRAEDLIKNVSSSEEPETEHYEKPEMPSNDESKTQEELKTEMYDKEFDDGIEESSEELTIEEKQRLKEAAEEEFKQRLAKAKKAEEEYNKAYNKAYNDYFNSNRRNGLKAKLKRFGITIITIAVLIVLCIILWHIPPIRVALIDFYNSNSVVKVIVDIVISIAKSFKS